MKSILVAINSKYVHTALGLRYVNEFCRKNAIEVTLIEETIQTPLLAVLAEITRAKPEVVGFSVHIWNKTYVYSLIEYGQPNSARSSTTVTPPLICTAPFLSR